VLWARRRLVTGGRRGRRPERMEEPVPAG